MDCGVYIYEKGTAMGIKEELHKIEERIEHREAEDAVAADKKTIANGEAAQKKLVADEAKEAAAAPKNEGTAH